MRTDRRAEPTIRPLAAGDVEALLRFYAGLSAATVHFYEPYSAITRGIMAEVVDRAESGRDFARVLVTPEGEIVGHVFLSDIGGAEPSLGMGIADDLQSRGWGRRLLAEALAEADGRPEVQGVILTVNKQNARALKLYTRFGFSVYGECDHREPGDSSRMRRAKRADRTPESRG